MFIIKEGTPADKIGEGTDSATLDSIAKFLEKTGHVVRTTAQDASFLQSRTQEEINKVLGERNTQFEATIFETTGIPKNQGEKFHEYHKRAVTEKTANVKVLEDKIKEFEKTGLQGSTLAQEYKAQLEKAQGQIQALNTEWTTKFQEKDKEIFTTRVNSELDKVKAEIRSQIDPTIKPELVDDIMAARMAKFNAENKPFDLEGMIVFKDPTTNQTKTSKTDGKPLAIKEVFTPYVADIIAKQRQQQGAGSGENGSNGNSGQAPKWKDIVLPETVKSQMQLTDYLAKDAKLDVNSKEYSEAFEGLKGALPLRTPA